MKGSSDIPGETSAAAAISLLTPDAEELADFLRFLSEWLTADPSHLGDSLVRFMNGHPYDIDMLLRDLVRLRSLLGSNDAADF